MRTEQIGSIAAIPGLLGIGRLGSFECRPQLKTNPAISIYFGSLNYKATIELRFR